MLLLPLLLVGCQSSPEPEGQPRAALPPLPPASQPGGAVVAQPAPTGLIALPSAQQVVMAQALGRPDPFLPVPTVGVAAGATAPGLPPGFRFTGVIRSGNRAQALVQFGSEAGTLRSGDVGDRTTKLLPAGWAVGGIDVSRGRLILRVSGRAVVVSLDAQG